MSTFILNQQKIDELSIEVGSDNVPMLFEIFLGEMETYLDNLQRYLGSDQLLYLQEISHALKSSAASFGADCLCELATSIDHKAKADKLSVDGEEVNHMIDLLRNTRDVYRSWSQ